STITQQVIRNVYNHPRTLKRKIIEIWFALRLENMLSKVEILEQYLNRVQFGNQTFGIESAARLYFDKPFKNLSLAEAAFLVGLPNAPSLKNPYRSIDLGVRRQQYILAKMKACGFISPEEYNNAISEPLRIVPVEKQFRAPHFVEMIKQEVCKAGFDNINEVHTTLDLHIQSSVEMIVKNNLQTLKSKNVTNAAAFGRLC
ncbi:MAG: transglycosylase domain-containing protein, partial [Bacteroidota bacterium]|nr:transglycosylase domain-containing protein [Bacteroidota bacterium]